MRTLYPRRNRVRALTEDFPLEMTMCFLGEGDITTMYINTYLPDIVHTVYVEKLYLTPGSLA